MLAMSGMAASHAQSSVTLYGTADVGIGRIKSGAPGGNDASGRTQMLASSALNNTSSYIGVRGVEDLGGGNKAGFSFEANLDLDDGSSVGAGAGFWGRGARMWLEGGWGTLQLGRTLNTSFWGLASWELTGAAVYSVAGATYGWVGNGPRSSSLFAYKTPDLHGFSGELGYIFAGDNVIAGATRSKWDMHVKYANGPAAIALSANWVQNAKTSYALGGRYNVGNVILAASLQDAAKEQARRHGATLGAKYTAGLASITLDVAHDFKNEWGARKYTNLLLEGKYALSKRTFIYTVVQRMDGLNNYGAGVRHNF